MNRAQSILLLIYWIGSRETRSGFLTRYGDGAMQQLAESLLRRPGQSANHELLAGAALTAGHGRRLLPRAQRKRSNGPIDRHCGTGSWHGDLAGVDLLASRHLVDESHAVIRALEQEDLPHAPGRDWRELSAAIRSLSARRRSIARSSRRLPRAPAMESSRPCYTWQSVAFLLPWPTRRSIRSIR